LGSLSRGVALALALLATSCGEGEMAGEPAAPETSIEVTLWPSGREGGPPRTAVLTCDPPGGSHERAEEACTALTEQEDALAPVAGNIACTQIFGGPEEARVAGVVRGRTVDARFSRNNGCEIDRWDRLAPLFEIS
jgi:hypothetical protein